MSRILVSAGETSIAAGVANTTTVDSARFVRVVNDSGAKAIVYVVDANYSGIGSVTLLNNAVEIIEKHPEDGIYYTGSGNIRLARVGVTN
tara:strand:- start:51 stop:320 length:270 start_codon:yes stop_codon:yes gene_type:complete